MLSFLISSLLASVKACDSSPCHNGGTCVNSGDSFTCICKDGYEGPLCEADINNCNPFPWYIHNLSLKSLSRSSTFTILLQTDNVQINHKLHVSSFTEFVKRLNDVILIEVCSF